MFKNLFEAPEVEVARLAQAPVSSINHSLSLLPVNIRHIEEDMLIELPRLSADDTHTIVVVPFERFKEHSPASDLPLKLHQGTWRCLVVASDDPSRPVGGHRLGLPAAQLARGTLRTIEIPAAAA